MRSKQVLATAIVLALLMIVSLAGCSKGSTAPQSTSQPSTTVSAPPSRQVNSSSGTLPGATGAAAQTPTATSVMQKLVSGTGTLAVATYANLYFGTAGQIKTLNVNPGDRVTRGTFLAKLDTTSLEASLALAKVNLSQAILAQTQAQAALLNAQFTLDKTQAVSDQKDAITKLQTQITVAQMNISQAQGSQQNDYTYWVQNLKANQDALKLQKQNLAQLLAQPQYSGVVVYDIMGQPYDRLTVEDASIKAAAVNSAQQTLNKSQDSINQAQKSLDLAQQQLDQATITAPFDGLVASVNQNQGDILSAPSQSQHPVIYLIDPSTMQMNIGVNELDMPKVSLNQKASISIDAYPGIKIDGYVAAISLVPTVQGGIVDYTVTVSFSVPSGVGARIGMDGRATITVQ